MWANAQLRRVLTSLAITACGVMAVGVADASGAPAYKRISVSGTQVVVDEAAGQFRLEGDLVGSWTITSFKELATSPLLQAIGTERFEGCLDRNHDGSCSGDPSGVLRLKFRYWAMFGAANPESLLAGACWHPIVSGRGAFGGARGVLQMLDFQTSEGVQTAYVGQIKLPRGKKARGYAASAAAAPRGCGSGG
jgi:hypothetical protein